MSVVTDRAVEVAEARAAKVEASAEERDRAARARGHADELRATRERQLAEIEASELAQAAEAGRCEAAGKRLASAQAKARTAIQAQREASAAMLDAVEAYNAAVGEIGRAHV